VSKLKSSELKTPALLLDLDRMNSNLQTMAGFFQSKPAKLRPHFKGHQVLALASRQLDAGATGITCARLDHAEALVRHGIRTVLIANEIAGDSAIRQLVELSHSAPVILAVDNLEVVEDLARIAGKHAAKLNVVVDIDVGLGRCGVSSAEDALYLAQAALTKGLTFRGLMGYGGGNHNPPGVKKERAAHAKLQPLLNGKALLESAGIAVEMVTCGATGDYTITGAAPGVTEVQAGSYLFMDAVHSAFAPEFHLSLSVLATVISKTGNRIVVDAGMKALGCGKELPPVKNNDRLRVRALHAEHAILEAIEASFHARVGDKIEIWVQHLDPVIQMHECIHGMRDGQVEEIFPIVR
jgi:D-serine deaminase-like pyridoxal phosphate-dependent protein